MVTVVKLTGPHSVHFEERYSDFDNTVFFTLSKVKVYRALSQAGNTTKRMIWGILCVNILIVNNWIFSALV